MQVLQRSGGGGKSRNRAAKRRAERTGQRPARGDNVADAFLQHNALGSLRVAQAQSSGSKESQLAIKPGIIPNVYPPRLCGGRVGEWAATTVTVTGAGGGITGLDCQETTANITGMWTCSIHVLRGGSNDAPEETSTAYGKGLRKKKKKEKKRLQLQSDAEG